MVNPSCRLTGQAGGVTTTKSLLTWTLLLLGAASGQAKVDHYVRPHNIQRSATVDVAPSASRRAAAGSSPAGIPLLNNEVHTAKFRNTAPEQLESRRYQDASAPAREIGAVRAPLEQSVESSGLTAIPGARPLQDWEADDIILLSTIDGSLHARDRRTGQHRWILDMSEDPMIETVHYPQTRTPQEDMFQENEYMFIVEPSKDGQLYAQFMNPAMGLVKLPATVKKMAAETPFNMLINKQHLAVTSQRLVKSYVIDTLNGEILYEFPKHRASGRADPQPRCRRRNDLELEDPACRPGRTIRLGRNIYTFTISNESTGQDLCTIKFSEWATNKADADLQQQYLQSLDGFDIQSYHNGRIIGVDSSEGAERVHRYTHFLASPIAQIFDIVRSRDDEDGSTPLVILSRPTDLPFSQQQAQAWRDEMKNSRRVFINKTERGHWYAMSEYSYPGFTNKAPFAESRWIRDGTLLDIDGDLDEIIGVHELANEQSAHAPVHLTISPPPENDNSNAIDTGKQVVFQEPPQPPALPYSHVDTTQSWSSGLFGVVFGILFVLLLDQKFGFMSNKYFQTSLGTQPANMIRTDIQPPAMVLTEKEPVAAPVQEVLTQEPLQGLLSNDVKLAQVTTPGHSREQSVASASSPKKKSVKIGEADDNLNNSSDADSNDDEVNNDGFVEVNAEPTSQESTTSTQSRKFKTKRGKRGGQKNNKKKKSMNPAVFDEKPIIAMEHHLDNGMTQIGRLKIDVSEEKCLGRGSNGTAVYPGILDGREVAVKRLIKSANNLAEKEIKHLVSSDENPHVIRYFGKEESRDFFYIALDQFTTSLDQFIEHPERFPTLIDTTLGFDVKDCLRQITDGVQHLHSLKLVHRDIKPQNVLVRAVKSNRPSTGMPKLQFVISDFGLCKPLEDGAMSTFAPTANHTAAGTTGWRAPELLVSPRDAIAAPSVESTASRTTTSTTHSSDGTTIDLSTGRRATKAIDIFSLGCVFYYVMTRGGHPFDVGGSSLGRDLNIKENNFTTELMRFHKYEYDAEDLIMQMVNHEPKNRPDTFGVLKHPYFWTPEQKLEFVCLVSDCYEREKNSITDFHAKGPVTRAPAEEESLVELSALEALAPNVIGLNSKKEIRDFLHALPKTFLNGMGKQRSYTGTRMIDLLRLIRNKKNHFRDLPEEVQALILARGPSLEEGYYGFWADRFPALLINCHANIVERQLTERFRLERWYE